MLKSWQISKGCFPLKRKGECGKAQEGKLLQVNFKVQKRQGRDGSEIQHAFHIVEELSCKSTSEVCFGAYISLEEFWPLHLDFYLSRTSAGTFCRRVEVHVVQGSVLKS